MTITRDASPVSETPAADSSVALAHFRRLLEFETDCWDVHASMTSGRQDFVLLDVRGRGAWNEGHIDGAVHFPHPEACTDCGACDTVCPMDLAPRQLLDGPPREQRGLYPEHSTNLSLCIRCGDCVRACEGTNLKREEPTPLALGFLPTARDRA